jgi:hypothetical protein
MIENRAEEIKNDFGVCNPEHSEDLHNFCSKCEIFVCEECILETHHDHMDQIRFLKEIFTQARVYYTNILKKMELDDRIQEKHNKLPVFGEYMTKIQEKIDKIYEELIKIILDHKQRLTNDILESSHIFNFKSYQEDLKIITEKRSKYKATLSSTIEKLTISIESQNYIENYNLSEELEKSEISKKIESIKGSSEKSQEIQSELEDLEISLNLGGLELDKIINIKFKEKPQNEFRFQAQAQGQAHEELLLEEEKKQVKKRASQKFPTPRGKKSLKDLTSSNIMHYFNHASPPDLLMLNLSLNKGSKIKMENDRILKNLNQYFDSVLIEGRIIASGATDTFEFVIPFSPSLVLSFSNISDPCRIFTKAKMLFYKEGHKLVAIHNGVVFCVGGRNQKLNPLMSCEKYSIYRDQWVKGPELNEKKYSVSASSYTQAFCKELYIFGGFDGNACFSTIEVLDTLVEEKGFQIITLDGDG